jgi:hypothetical protein
MKVLIFLFWLIPIFYSRQDATALYHADFKLVADAFDRDLKTYASKLAEAQFESLPSDAPAEQKFLQKRRVQMAIERQELFAKEVRNLASESLWSLGVHTNYKREDRIKIFDSLEDNYQMRFVYLDYKFFQALKKELIPE